jgi:hypothetical protein
MQSVRLGYDRVSMEYRGDERQQGRTPPPQPAESCETDPETHDNEVMTRR